jgi:hypothetical protein
MRGITIPWGKDFTKKKKNSFFIFFYIFFIFLKKKKKKKKTKPQSVAQPPMGGRQPTGLFQFFF